MASPTPGPTSETLTKLMKLFNHALVETLLEDPTDVKKMFKQLDSILMNVKSMKEMIQQVVVKNQPEAAATLEEDFEDSDAKLEKIEHEVKGVGDRVKRVEEDVRQYEDLVHGVVSDTACQFDVIADVQDRIDNLSQNVPFNEEEVQNLRKVSDKERLSSDGFYRRTLLLRNFRNQDHGEAGSYFVKCMKMLQRYDLGFLLDRADNFYVSDDLIKLTFSTRRIAIRNLLSAKNHVQNLSQCSVSVECLVPPSLVSQKRSLLQKMRELKQENFFTSYSIFESRSTGSWMMKVRVYKRGEGSFVFNSALEARQHFSGQSGHGQSGHGHTVNVNEE